jgi:hypothetical protein
MTAGLPGFALGGLFHLISALLAPFVELVRTVQGRTSRRRWLAALRQFVLAAAMFGAMDMTLRVILLIAPLPAGHSITVIPWHPIGITLGLLALVLTGAKGVHLAAPAVRRRRGRPRPTVSWRYEAESSTSE